MSIPIVNSSISPQAFHEQYISKRQPALFSALSPEFGDLHQRWTDDYLKQTAGESIVQVEIRENTLAKFGTCERTFMKFHEFISLLSSEEQNEAYFYLTVQKLEEDLGGPLQLFGAPLTELTRDFPCRPNLFGNMIPFQINVWIGHSRTGSSSRLHHDYHDNLYIVLRGTKRFRLFAPKNWEHLRVNGAQKMKADPDPNERVVFHPNGLISYGNWYREDGAHIGAVDHWKRTGRFDSMDEGDFDVKLDEFEEENDMDEDLEFKGFEDMSVDGNSNVDAVLEQMLEACERDGADESEEDEEDDFPLNFSLINLDRPREEILREFPEFEKADEVFEVEVRAGQMLYLPCGYFHEVVSVSGEEIGSHFALSYWMNPPVTNMPFDQPYKDSFWRERFEWVMSLRSDSICTFD